MNNGRESLQFVVEPADNLRLANLCGVHDDNIKAVSELLDVRIHRRGERFQVTGSSSQASKARALINQLYASADEQLEPEEIKQLAADSKLRKASVQASGIRTRNAAQRRYLEAISASAITFGVGASGTGKTFLAVASALEALDRHQVKHIVLVRPAVEAGESLGFLPGDPVQKVNPYLRPLQDALHEICRGSHLEAMLRQDRIELAPLAYMRGRTLADSFVILDEAQNCTRAQMLMFLTRLGAGSTCVVTGDESQIDLPRRSDSGLIDVLGKLDDVSGCSVVRFSAQDTLRHPVVAEILKAYAKRD